MKIIDIDKLFDNYISDYVYANIGKVNPEEIENKMPVLYNEFGDKQLKELDGKTPNTYYRDYSAEELFETLKQHLDNGVAVSDFLCEAITAAKGADDVASRLICEDNSDEFTVYLLNVLSELNCGKATAKYLDFILWDYDEGIRELATELLGKFADKEKESILSHFKDASKEKKACLTDVLSNCSFDDRVFAILIDEFLANTDNVPLYAAYLSKYGDDRALPFLLTMIENEKISYVDFEELRFAIEALGGEYTKKRDFSNDKYYKKIKNAETKFMN